MLEALGHRADVAASGAEALQKLSVRLEDSPPTGDASTGKPSRSRPSTETYDLVLVDASLPDTDLNTLIAEIRGVFAGAIAIMSGFAEEDATETVEYEVAGFLAKPFGMEKLAEFLDSTQ